MKLRTFSPSYDRWKLLKCLLSSLMMFGLTQSVHALFSQGYSCEGSDINQNSLVRTVSCSALGFTEMIGSAECLGVFKFNSEHIIYEKTSHFLIEDGLGCGSIHISRKGKYIAVIDSLYGREVDRAGLRIYSENGILIGYWEIKTFLTAEELEYEVKVGEGFLWFDSGSFNEKNETFTFVGPAREYKTDAGNWRAVRWSENNESYTFTIDLVEKTISRQ